MDMDKLQEVDMDTVHDMDVMQDMDMMHDMDKEVEWD